MRYAGIVKNDLSAAPGVCVTFYVQGCPHHCPGCHNPETWSYDGGKEFTLDVLKEIEESLIANGVHRDLCIMGGEPLCPENQFLTYLVISTIKEKFPSVKVYIWTGYNLDDLKKTGVRISQILELTEAVIDGPFILEQRDITLPMRGSRNQRIIYMKDIDLSEF